LRERFDGSGNPGLGSTSKMASLAVGLQWREKAVGIYGDIGYY